MAKKAESKGEGKSRKKPVFRTDAQLMAGGIHERVLLAVRKAFNIANKHGFAGTVRAGKNYPNGILFQKTKEGGSYWTTPEDSASFKAVHTAAKSALSDIEKQNYSASVKALVDAFSNVGEGGRGSRSLNTSMIKDLKL